MVDVPADVLDELELNLALEANQYEALLMEALEERGLAEFAQKRWPAGSSKGGQFAPSDIIHERGVSAGTFVKEQKGREVEDGIAANQKVPSAMESKLLYYSVESGSRPINNYLRHGEIDNPHTPGEAKRLRRVINKNPISQEAVVYRGIDGKAARRMFGESVRVGDVVLDKGIASTSFSKRIATQFAQRSGGFGITMVIRAPKGTKALVMKPYSMFAREREMILAPRSKFKVLGMRNTPYGGEVHMEVVQ